MSFNKGTVISTLKNIITVYDNRTERKRKVETVAILENGYVCFIDMECLTFQYLRPICADGSTAKILETSVGMIRGADIESYNATASDAYKIQSILDIKKGSLII